MAARTATKTDDPVTDPGPETEPEKVDHETLIGAIKEVLAEIGITGSPSAEPTQGANEVEAEEIETPRQAEARVRRAVESAVGALHIHVGESAAPKKEETKEPEQVPGGPSKLAKWIGLAP